MKWNYSSVIVTHCMLQRLVGNWTFCSRCRDLLEAEHSVNESTGPKSVWDECIEVPHATKSVWDESHTSHTVPAPMTLSLTLLHIFRVSLRPPTPGAINAPDSVTPVVLEWWPYVSNAEKGLTTCAFHYHNVSVRRTEMAYQHVRYSKENLKIHTGPLPPFLPSPSLPLPLPLPLPSYIPFSLRSRALKSLKTLKHTKFYGKCLPVNISLCKCCGQCLRADL